MKLHNKELDRSTISIYCDDIIKSLDWEGLELLVFRAQNALQEKFMMENGEEDHECHHSPFGEDGCDCDLERRK